MAKVRTSDGWLSKETLKRVPAEFPASGAKVGKAIGGVVGKAMKVPFTMAKKMIEGAKSKPVPLNGQQIYERTKSTEQMKKSSDEWQKKNPGKKVPKAFSEM